MSQDLSYLGTVNGPLIGYIMKEAAMRAMRAIRAMRLELDATVKGIKHDGGTDWVTNADILAQVIYLRVIREAFPLIGDVMTGELYYFRPGSDKTHRIDMDGGPELLVIDKERTLASQYILLRDPPDRLRSGIIANLLTRKDSSPFKNWQITGGSIGISTAKLWKGEVGAAILSSRKSTPWDSNPVLGISRRLGFVGFNLDRVHLTRYELTPHDTTLPTNHDILLVHESRQAELFAWCDLHKISRPSTD